MKHRDVFQFELPRTFRRITTLKKLRSSTPSMPTDSLPIFLLPGLGLDERLYATQRLEFPSLQVPIWLRPKWFESLPQYSRRIAQAIDPRGPCFVGGMSFGGMVALEMSRHLDCRGCFLISSVRSSAELPLWARLLAPGAWLLPLGSDRIAASLATAAMWTMGRRCPASWRQFCTHLSKTRAPMLPWACRAAVSWKPASTTCPVYQIHGDRDPILTHRNTRAEVIVPRGGHLLPLTHPFAVNDWLRRSISSES